MQQNMCAVSVMNKNGIGMKQYKCTLAVKDGNLEVYPVTGKVPSLELNQIAGLIISSTKELIHVFSNKERPQFQLEIMSYDRLKFVDLLIPHMTRLPIWFTRDQKLKDLFRNIGGETFFNDPQDNISWKELEDSLKNKLGDSEMPHQFFVVKDKEVHPPFPKLYSQIKFSNDGQGVSLSDLKFIQNVSKPKVGVEHKLYQKGNALYLVIAMTGQMFNQTNLLNLMGTKSVESINSIMDYSKGIMPINCIFENENGEKEVLMAIPLKQNQISLKKKMETNSFPQLPMAEWQKKVKKYAQQLATAILHLHDNEIIHRNISLQTVLINEKDELKLLVTETARYLGQKETAETTQLTGFQKKPLTKGKYAWEFDWQQFGIVLSCLLRQSETEGVILPSNVSEEAEDLVSKTEEKDVSDEIIRKDLWLNPPLNNSPTN